MENKEINFALLVHACDRYELLYKGFQYFFKKHWNFDIPCAYYFATEEKQIELDGFVNIRSGKGEWSDRLRTLLEKIPQSHIIYFQEDMWLNEDVDADFFQQLFKLVITNDIKQVKLHSANVYTTKATDTYIKGFNVAKIDNENSRYLMSHQVSVWDKAFFISWLNPNEDPWRNERRATKRMRKTNPEISHIDYFALGGNTPINNNLENALRSSYSSISINGTFAANSQPFIQILLEEKNESVKEYAQKIKYNFDHQLTHDGLKKPRKSDIFKRTKRFFIKITKS